MGGQIVFLRRFERIVYFNGAQLKAVLSMKSICHLLWAYKKKKFIYLYIYIYIK